MTTYWHPASTIDVTAFRKAMSSFPTGVTVVTMASGDGTMHGVTVNSFSSVSLNPMLVLVCLYQTSRAVGLIEQAGAFVVNVLSAGQQDLSRRFADRHRPAGPAMFDGVPLEPGVTGGPVLAGAAASFDCRLRQSYRAGDHLIVLGEVVALVHRPQVQPLIFHAGTHKSLEPESRPGRSGTRRFAPDPAYLAGDRTDARPEHGVLNADASRCGQVMAASSAPLLR
jgi:flavin reductase (DIM6/NTAB) family NADH-FMN oxidoreductase RutF